MLDSVAVFLDVPTMFISQTLIKVMQCHEKLKAVTTITVHTQLHPHSITVRGDLSSNSLLKISQNL